MSERKKDKFFCLIIVLLVIIILLLLFFTRFGKIENKYLVPTGNVDIFNIDIDCVCDEDDKCDNSTDMNENKDVKINKKTNKKVNKDVSKKNNEVINEQKSKSNNVYPTWDEERDKEVLNEVYVDDASGNYIYQKSLNIFNNAFYKYTNKIAPGVSNTYYFIVHNSSDMNVKYYVEMYANTSYDIDLKYRLKRNGSYVIGDLNNWVTADELKTSFSALDIKDSDKYSLDWKWEYESGNDNKDTYIGENMNDLYKLNIRFYIEQV